MKYLVFYSFIAACYANDLSGAVANFSLELLHNKNTETANNIVFSPFSVWTLLTSVALGASGNSKTELERTLRLPLDLNELKTEYENLTSTVLDTQTQDVTIKSNNYIFVDNGFDILPGYQNTVTSDFGTQIVRLDFKDSKVAANKANAIMKESGGTTSDVMEADDFKTSRMILTNIISFKGFWTTPFNKTDTEADAFYDESGRHIGTVKMMYQRAQVPYSNIEAVQAHVVELSYGDDDKFSMLILLPYPKLKVMDIYKKLTVEVLQLMFEKLESDMYEFDLGIVDLKLPRFQINSNILLNSALNKMGVSDIFNQSAANFDNISKENIHISKIIQKANIEVTEAGTDASADTSAYIINRIFPSSFIANRPFIYLILEKSTKTILFSGIYSEPSLF